MDDYGMAKGDRFYPAVIGENASDGILVLLVKEAAL